MFPETSTTLIVAGALLVASYQHLAKLPDHMTIDFAREPTKDYRLIYFSWGETWGRWSIGPASAIVFRKPLPASIRLTLKAQAFQSNIGQPVSVHCGRKPVQQVLSGSPELFTVNLQCRGNRIVFENPNPRTPREVGINNDPRQLGLGFVELAYHNQLTWHDTSNEKEGS